MICDVVIVPMIYWSYLKNATGKGVQETEVEQRDIEKDEGALLLKS